MADATPETRSAGPITPRPWWRRAVGAFGANLLVAGVATVLLDRALPTPWNRRVPIVLGLAAFFSYHPEWWHPRFRRATLVHAGFVFALGMAVVAVTTWLGWP